MPMSEYLEAEGLLLLQLGIILLSFVQKVTLPASPIILQKIISNKSALISYIFRKTSYVIYKTDAWIVSDIQG